MQPLFLWIHSQNQFFLVQAFPCPIVETHEVLLNDSRPKILGTSRGTSCPCDLCWTFTSVNICFGRKTTCEWLKMTVLEEPAEGVLSVLCPPLHCLGPDFFLQKSNFFEEKPVLSSLLFLRPGHPHSSLLLDFQMICQCDGACSYKLHMPLDQAGGEAGDRVWDGWMASSTQWTWVWASSRRW